MKKRPLEFDQGANVYRVRLAHDRGFALVSPDDAEVVGRYNWRYCKPRRSHTAYAITEIDGSTVQLHRFVAAAANIDIGDQVDHKDGDGLNCTRDNLRHATHSQNQANVPVRASNTSGVKGVTFAKDRGQWLARVTVEGRVVSLGYFDDLEVASNAVRGARVVLHGEFANDRAAA